jgi:short-subunit dehydrogenase
MNNGWHPLVVLITGASSGIGRATALALAVRGVDVVAIGRRAEALATLAATCSERITPLVLDITDDAAVSGLAAHLAHIGRVPDVLVNNAGYAQIGPVEDTPLDAIRAQFDTNFVGAIAMIQAVLPAMRRRQRGRIVNVSSVAGIVSLPFMGVYCASKFALEAATDAMRLEISPFGIDAVLVEPAAIASDFAQVSEAFALHKPSATSSYDELFDAAKMRAASDTNAAPVQIAVDAVVSAIFASPAPIRIATPARGRRLIRLKRFLPVIVFDAMLRRRFGIVKRSITGMSRNAMNSKGS